METKVRFFKNGVLKKEYIISSYNVDVWNQATIKYLESLGFTDFGQDIINGDYLLHAVRVSDSLGRPDQLVEYKLSICNS